MACHFTAVETDDSPVDGQNSVQKCGTSPSVLCLDKWVRDITGYLLPFVSLLLYLGDITTNLCYAGILIKYAGEDHLDVNLGHNFLGWAACIITLFILSEIFINFIAAFTRHRNNPMGKATVAIEAAKCLIPGLHIMSALCKHVWTRVSGDNSSNVVEWAVFMRMLQTILGAVPQTGLQLYFFFTDLMPKHNKFDTWLPVASVSVSILSAMFGYTGYITYRYYDTERQFLSFWQVIFVFITSGLLFFGRTISIALTGLTYGILLSILSVAGIWSLIFAWRTIILRCSGTNIGLRIAVSAIETFAVDMSSWVRMVAVSGIYIFLNVLFVVKYHDHPIEWSVFGLALGAHVLGGLLVLPCTLVYGKAYKILHLSLQPKEPDKETTKRNSKYLYD